MTYCVGGPNCTTGRCGCHQAAPMSGKPKCRVCVHCGEEVRQRHLHVTRGEFADIQCAAAECEMAYRFDEASWLAFMGSGFGLGRFPAGNYQVIVCDKPYWWVSERRTDQSLPLGAA